MCSGVITITAIITACASASAATPAATPGRVADHLDGPAAHDVAVRATSPPRGERGLAGHQQRVGPQEQRDDERGGEHRRPRRTRTARSAPGSPTARRGPAGHAGEVRAGDRADGGRPDHDRQRPGPAGRARRGRWRRSATGCWRPSSSRAAWRRPAAAGTSRTTPATHAQRGAGGAEQVAERQPGPASAAAHQVREQERRDARRRAPAWSAPGRRASRCRRRPRRGARRRRCRW